MAFGAGVLGVLRWNLGNSILTPLNGLLFMDVVPVTAFAISASQGTVTTHLQLLGASLTAAALIMNNVYMRHRLAAAARASAALRRGARSRPACRP